MRVRIWGQVSFNGNLCVDRSGTIYLPQVGTIQVTGLSFSALDQRLRSALSKSYRNFDLSVEIGQIRSIQIYVSGQARRTGAYTISSLSSLVDALFASGGPSPQGSLRHILLKRQGQTVTDFDLYALLIHGDKSKDVRLLPEDVIYIPPAGPEVAIRGSVGSPAIYDLRGGETVGELIEMAGKTTAVAPNSRGRRYCRDILCTDGLDATLFSRSKANISLLKHGGTCFRCPPKMRDANPFLRRNNLPINRKNFVGTVFLQVHPSGVPGKFCTSGSETNWNGRSLVWH